MQSGGTHFCCCTRFLSVPPNLLVNSNGVSVNSSLIFSPFLFVCLFSGWPASTPFVWNNFELTAKSKTMLSHRHLPLQKYYDFLLQDQRSQFLARECRRSSVLLSCGHTQPHRSVYKLDPHPSSKTLFSPFFILKKLLIVEMVICWTVFLYFPFFCFVLYCNFDLRKQRYILK